MSSAIFLLFPGTSGRPLPRFDRPSLFDGLALSTLKRSPRLSRSPSWASSSRRFWVPGLDDRRFVDRRRSRQPLVEGDRKPLPPALVGRITTTGCRAPRGPATPRTHHRGSRPPPTPPNDLRRLPILRGSVRARRR